MYCKLLTFDVTNTLLKFACSPGAQYAKIAALYGVQTDPEKLTVAFKTLWKSMSKDHPNFGARSGMGYKDWWTRMVEQTFHNSGYKVDINNMKKISEHLIEVYGTNACWNVQPGVVEVLNDIRKSKSHLSIGVISNFDVRLHSVLDDTKLSQYFDFVLASYDCGYYKPQREIFQLALDQVNCLPSEAVHVGDDVELDYLAARNAGWNAVLFCTDDKKRANISKIPEESPAVINDIRQTVEMV
ncbi:hypothetical protein CHUAL_006548 [Chamberlinius hualienensis]